jgi:hypothetical protein
MFSHQRCEMVGGPRDGEPVAIGYGQREVHFVVRLRYQTTNSIDDPLPSNAITDGVGRLVYDVRERDRRYADYRGTF